MLVIGLQRNQTTTVWHYLGCTGLASYGSEWTFMDLTGSQEVGVRLEQDRSGPPIVGICRSNHRHDQAESRLLPTTTWPRIFTPVKYTHTLYLGRSPLSLWYV